MNKKLIKLTESDLHRIVKESVNKVLNEIGDTTKGQYMLGRLAARTKMKGDNISDIKKYASNRRKEQNFGYDGTPFFYENGMQANPMGQEFLDGREDYCLGNNIPPNHYAISRTTNMPMDGSKDSERINAKHHLDNDEERWRKHRALGAKY